MKKIAQCGILLMAALLVFGVVACPTDGGGSKVALLTSLTLTDVDATLGNPISKATWDTANSTDFGPEYLGMAIVKDGQFLGEDVDLKIKTSSGATAKYAVVTNSTAKPSTWTSINKTIAVNDGNMLYIQVTAENKKTINYYKIEVAAENSIATLTSVSVGTASANIGTGNAQWGSVVQGSLGLSTIAANNATLAIRKGHISQTISFAKVEAATGVTTAPTTWTVLQGSNPVSTQVTIADGDFLCIKVVSGDGDATLYYIIKAEVGQSADITNIQFKTTTNTTTFTYASGALGTSAATLAGVKAGEALMAVAQPTSGFGVSVTVAEEGATYKLIKVTGAADPTFGTEGEATITFEDEDFLYIEVTSSNGKNKLFYKVQVSLVKAGEIQYGIPKIEADKIDKEVWDTASQTYEIRRLFPGDTRDKTGTWKDNPDTWGEAKALWDDKGLYVYWKVTDPTKDSGGSEHNADSVELFINEAYEDGDTGNKYSTGGSQYRVGRDSKISGDPAAAVTLLRNEGKSEVWEWEDDDTGNKGYIVTMYVPWRFTSQMHVDGLIPDNKQFGMELQINACDDGSRAGTVVWNNSETSNYQKTQGFGIMTLIPPKGPRVTIAETPQINTQPAHANYTIGTATAAAALTVNAKVEKGVLSYQWWSTAVSANDAGEEITDATTATYVPPITTEGRTWYWCVVTNTDESANEGYKTADVNSNRARITVAPVTVNPVTFNTGWKNTNPPGASQYATLVNVEFPDNFDISLYTNFVINFKMYSDTSTEIDSPEYGKAQYNWLAADGGKLKEVYNFGADTTAGSDAIPSEVLDSAGCAGIEFLTSDDTAQHAVQYLEITSIVFSKQ